MVAELTPIQTRAQDAIFVAQCSLDGLRDRLPLRWPAPPDTPPSLKSRYALTTSIWAGRTSKTSPPGSTSPTST